MVGCWKQHPRRSQTTGSLAIGFGEALKTSNIRGSAGQAQIRGLHSAWIATVGSARISSVLNLWFLEEVGMTMKDSFLAQLEAEAGRTRRALESTPEGHDEWKPHEKSMPLGRLAMIVATMPSWLALIINRDELDLNPPGGSNISQRPLRTRAELVQALDEGTSEAHNALLGTTEEHLLKPWRLLVAGRVVSEEPRHVVVRDTFTHLAHHRGQLTVYLRLNNVPVPAIYGPSADDSRFD
jgi:uncharacterized damage-inducible protein DinB